MNRIFLIGNVSSVPELRTLDNGTTLCTFGLAVNRRRKADGQPTADFFRVTTWRALAENCAKYLAKGRKCCVVGELLPREYTANDGARRTTLEVQADAVEFLSSAESTQAQGGFSAPVQQPFSQGGFVPVDEIELPF